MRRKTWQGICGFTLLEAVISTALLGLIVGAGLSLYASQQKQWIIQEQIADMQQNLRVSMDELSKNTRMAGCGIFPWGLDALKVKDTNPDTVFIRTNPFDCMAVIGKNVLSNELHTRDHPRCFKNGVRAYIWDYIGQYEWFTVDQVDTNMGAGWHEIHSTQNLVHMYNKKDNPRAMVFYEFKYYIDQTSDPDHPALMRSVNGHPAQVFAENIETLDVHFIMNDASVTTNPSDINEVKVIQIELQARTERQDQDWTNADFGDGYRRRTLASKVDARNVGL